MAEYGSQGAPAGPGSAEDPSPRNRRDARANRERILLAASDLLASDPDVSVDEIAAAAGVARGTVYRHFQSRPGLMAALRVYVGDHADANTRDTLRPAGELASRGPVPLDVVDVLNKVPPHLLGDQIVAEAQRLAGARSVALYLVDIDGTLIRRLAGSREFPDQISIPLAVGPEIPREALPALHAELRERFPSSATAPLVLRGRAIGILIAVDAPEESLRDLARHAAAALSLADGYTDSFDATRRHRDISAASEVQQNLLPPRIARISGGLLAGNVLPGYEIGGDWFDYVENPDGAWIATADSAGSGTTAAAVGAITLGAFRAKRRRGANMTDTVHYIEQVLGELQVPDASSSAIIARWHGPTAGFFWIACGDLQPCLVTADGQVERLPGTTHPRLGAMAADQRTVHADVHRLQMNERVLLISDGVTGRQNEQDAAFGLPEIAEAISRLGPAPTAPAIVRAVEELLIDPGRDPLQDDATIVALSPSSP